MLTNRNDAHSKARRYSSHSTSDAPHADQAKRGAGNLVGMLSFVPDRFLPPDALLLQQHGLRNFLRQGKHQGHDVFGDHRTMDFARIGQNHGAVDQFREEHLVNGGTGRVNPAQGTSGSKLIRSQGNGEYNFCIAQLRFNSFVTVTLRDLQTGILLGQALAKPRRQFPEIEPVMHYQEHFHAENLNTEAMSNRHLHRCWRERRPCCIQRSRYRKL